MKTEQAKAEYTPKNSKSDPKHDEIYGNSLLTKILEKLPRRNSKREQLCQFIKKNAIILKSDKKNRNFWDNYFLKDSSELKKQ